MSSFEVQPADLPAAAVRIAATGRELASVQAAMASVQGAAGAADAPQVAAALSALAQALSATAGSIGVATEALAATTHASAGAYEATDLTGMPNIGGLPAAGDLGRHGRGGVRDQGAGWRPGRLGGGGRRPTRRLRCVRAKRRDPARQLDRAVVDRHRLAPLRGPLRE